MLVILLAPSVAALADLLRERYSVSKAFFYVIAVIITVPSLLVWLSGYTYASNQLDYAAIACCITGGLLALMTYSDGEQSGKLKATIVLTIFIGLLIGILLFLSLFAGKDKILSKTSYRNYVAIYSQDYDQVLQGPKRITIKKTKAAKLIDKTIVSRTLDERDTTQNCRVLFVDDQQEFEYNYCNNSLTKTNSTAGNMGFKK